MAKKIVFPPTNYAKFVPLLEVLEHTSVHAARPIGDDDRIASYTARHLNDGAFLATVSDALEKMGFRRIHQQISYGSSALVFEANDHQMLRIVSFDEWERRPVDWAMLQPLHSVQEGRGGERFVLEILPKVHTLEEIVNSRRLSRQYKLKKTDIPDILKNLVTHYLHDNNRFFFDAKPKNVGILRDAEGNNVPVVIDPGAIIDINDAYKKVSASSENYYEAFIRMASLHIPEFEEVRLERGGSAPTRFVHEYLQNFVHNAKPKYNFREAQELHLSSLGLERDRINKVISASDFEKFCQDRQNLASLAAQHGKTYDPKNTVFARMAERGQYPREVAAKLKRNSKIGFCHRIEAASKSLLPSLPK